MPRTDSFSIGILRKLLSPFFVPLKTQVEMWEIPVQTQSAKQQFTPRCACVECGGNVCVSVWVRKYVCGCVAECVWGGNVYVYACMVSDPSSIAIAPGYLLTTL